MYQLKKLINLLLPYVHNQKQFYEVNYLLEQQKRLVEFVIRAVIFDLDGTLIVFNLDINACRTKVIKYLTEQGLPSSLFSLKESAFDMLVKVKEYLKAKRMDLQQFEKFRNIVFSIVESFELEAAKTTKMFVGIPETLQTLRGMKLRIALCTISSERATDYILKRFGLHHFFDAVITRESVEMVKPHPAHLEATLDALKIGQHEALLVGDSVKDMECAKQLDVIAVGVATGISSIKELSDSGAHYLASSANDIPLLIQQLNRQK
jgi:phosphoglycolate phosphatase